MNIDYAAFTLLAAATVVSLVASLVHARRARRLRQRHDALSGEVDALQREIRALCAGAHGVGGHLSRVDQQLKRLYERQDQVELRDALHHEYDHALKLVRGGANIEEVMTQCNLVRAEAELLMMLHGMGEPAGREAARGQSAGVRAAS